MIAIISNKHLKFPAYYEGFIKLEIVGIFEDMKNNTYTLNIEDKCFIETEVKETITEIEETDISTIYRTFEVTKKVKQQIGETIKRTNTYPIEYLRQVEGFLKKAGKKVDPSKGVLDNTRDLFREGLLLITQQECLNNEGRYYSTVMDWVQCYNCPLKDEGEILSKVEISKEEFPKETSEEKID